MKPLRESSRPALRQCAGKIAAEATQWWLGCGDDSQEQRGAELILQMHDVVDCADSLGPCVKCDKTVSVDKAVSVVNSVSGTSYQALVVSTEALYAIL